MAAAERVFKELEEMEASAAVAAREQQLKELLLMEEALEQQLKGAAARRLAAQFLSKMEQHSILIQLLPFQEAPLLQEPAAIQDLRAEPIFL